MPRREAGGGHATAGFSRCPLYLGDAAVLVNPANASSAEPTLRDVQEAVGLLRARRERPRHGRPTYQCDKTPPLHSMIWSARKRSSRLIVSPSAFAVLRLTTSSNFVG